MESKLKKMFGEYVIYINNKPLFTVCDDTVYVKELECIRTIMGDAEKGFPYEGAKECYIVDTDNKELLEKIIPKIGQVISIPIKRNSKKEKLLQSNTFEWNYKKRSPMKL